MNPTGIAVMGGTGLTRLEGFSVDREERVDTPFGPPSGPLVHGHLGDSPVTFMSRHGETHTIPPHRVNYRANIHALRAAGCLSVIAVAAVGAINPAIQPGRLIFPEQLIDYTWGRAQTFFDEGLDDVVHIDFTRPYCDSLRARLIDAARKLGLGACEKGTYAATQGPRLESAAEIDRLERDGCDIVGMTGMPEAALAREAGLCYATCAVSANWAAGRSDREISMDEIRRTLKSGMREVTRLLGVVASRNVADASW